jgi:uncharacterized protein
MTKADVRALARFWDLPNWEKPASPCLSSRLAPGLEVTRERIAAVEAAEAYLHAMGLPECRVRLHPSELARIEVPFSALAQLTEAKTAKKLVLAFQALGFQFITLDLGGFRTGSLNNLVNLDIKSRFAQADSPAS